MIKREFNCMDNNYQIKGLLPFGNLKSNNGTKPMYRPPNCGEYYICCGE
jgi:hypothetical protein